MKLHVLSDLHLEQGPFTATTDDADVVVLAGDVAPGVAGVRWAAETFPDRPVLYLAGNHEYYGEALPALDGRLRAAAAGSSVTVLQDDQLVLDGVRFLGCTLWSDFEFDGPERRERSMTICEQVVSDYSQIRFGSPARALRPADTRTVHLASRAWLSERLATRHDGPTVVLTHHAPLIRTRPEHPVLRAVAGAFASDLTGLMGADQVRLWVYGHTHRVADLDVAGTRVISNPRGYPHEPVDGFRAETVVEV